jgi:DNA-binding CsgD family transcriptional regulator
MPADQSSIPTSAIERLTEKERECLRLWLEHKTAKEIALQLDVSHHAVEKRLKMARTKLGVATSLEAARVLARAEGYDRPVTGSPDLPPPPVTRKSRQLPTIVFGALAMFVTLVAALALAPTTPAPETVDQTREIELNGNSEKIFDELDKNGSGFLEKPESPFVTLVFEDRDTMSDGGESTTDAAVFTDAEQGEMLTGTATLGDASDQVQLAEFYDAADTDKDGRISFREYTSWSRARLAELGIEISTVLKIQKPSEN